MLDERDIRLIVPQVRRYLDAGVAAASAAIAYTDNHLVQVTADAISELVLITGGTGFPYVISASATDGSGYITEYSTEPAITLTDRALVAVQAALGQAWADLRGYKTREKISDEGSTWEYEKSVTALRQRVDYLIDMRKTVLRAAAAASPPLDRFVDLIETRAPTVAAEINPA